MVDAQVVAHVRHAEDVAQSEHRRGLQAALAVGVAEHAPRLHLLGVGAAAAEQAALAVAGQCPGEVLPEGRGTGGCLPLAGLEFRSEEHTSELQSLMRISYAVFCLKKKIYTHDNEHQRDTS